MEFHLILTPSSALFKKKVNPFFGQSLKYKSNRLTCISLWSWNICYWFPLKIKDYLFLPHVSAVHWSSRFRNNKPSSFWDLGRPAAARIPYWVFKISAMVSGCCKFITSRCPHPESAHIRTFTANENRGKSYNKRGTGLKNPGTRAVSEIPNLSCVEDGLSGSLKWRQQGGKTANGKLILSENVFNAHKT